MKKKQEEQKEVDEETTWHPLNVLITFSTCRKSADQIQSQLQKHAE